MSVVTDFFAQHRVTRAEPEAISEPNPVVSTQPLEGHVVQAILREHRDHLREAVANPLPGIPPVWRQPEFLIAYRPDTGRCVGTSIDPEVAKRMSQFVMVSNHLALTAEDLGRVRVGDDGIVSWGQP